MVKFIFFLQPAQHEDRVLDCWFIYKDRLESPGQRGILFHILAIFIQCRCPDAAQLAACQCRLQKIGGVHRPIRLASANQLMHLVDEQHHLAIARFHFLENGFQTLFEFAAIFCTSHQRAHIQRQQCLIGKRLWHIAIDNPLRQPFGDGRLANAGLANQNRIVLCPAGQNLDRPPDLCLAANDRVELAAPCRICQVRGKF